MTTLDEGQAPDLAIFLHDLRGGGAERAMLRLAEGVHSLGRHVELWLVQQRGEHLSKVPPGVTVHSLNAVSVASSIPKLAGWLKRRRPRALLSALTHVNVAAIVAARLSGFEGRLVVSERNQISEMAGAARGLRGRLAYGVARHAYREADAVVAVSQGVADDVLRFTRLQPDRMRVIYNPVVDQRLMGEDGRLPEHPWLNDGGPPVLLAAGRLKPQKGFEDLIRAFGRLRGERPVRLVVLGEGPERSNLQRLVEELGLAEDVSLPGFCADPFPAMRKAAVFVLPSKWEGFPNALVEAMSAGAAVVATDCPSGPMEILAGGQFGRLTPVGDPEALASAIGETLDAPRDRQQVIARARCFTIEAASRQYLQVLGV
jgi:glycosyltransferase involved in cell wall biosynthesis